MSSRREVLSEADHLCHRDSSRIMDNYRSMTGDYDPESVTGIIYSAANYGADWTDGDFGYCPDGYTHEVVSCLSIPESDESKASTKIRRRRASYDYYILHREEMNERSARWHRDNRERSLANKKAYNLKRKVSKADSHSTETGGPTDEA
jgi:hypothetical protein